jgi:hypothetical protein
LMLHHLKREVSNFIYRLCNAGDFFSLRQQGIVKLAIAISSGMEMPFLLAHR